MRVGILFGGNSFEHDVSTISANIVSRYLQERHELFLIYVDYENELFLIKDLKNENFFKKSKAISFVKGGIKKGLRKQKIDVLISVMHGANGEDGFACSLANFYQIPYVGSNHISAGLLMDKYYTYCVLNDNNYPVLKSELMISDKEINHQLTYPIIIKPATLGSSIGIEVAKDDNDLKTKISSAFEYDNRVLLQEYITNFREFNQAAYVYNGEVILSRIEEVFKNDDILSFNDKYLGVKITHKHHYLEDENLVNKINNFTKGVYELFDLSGVVRVDYILKEDKLYINEINTTPGSLAYYLFEGETNSYFSNLIYEALINFQNRKYLHFESDILEHSNGIKKG